MANKRLKRILCVLIVLCLMFVSSFSVYYFFERSCLYNDVNIYYLTYNNNFENVLDNFNIREYYSKLPETFLPENRKPSSLDYHLDFTHSIIENPFFDYHPYAFPEAVVRAKYIGKASNPEYSLRGEFKFKITEVVAGDGFGTVKVGDTVQYFSNAFSAHRYSVEEYMFNYYGAKYEPGEEYLLFLLNPVGNVVNYKANDIPYYYVQAGGICLNKLSGEYPSIKTFPGPIEYDATYFGAETKFVTADEFIDFFMKAAREREFEYQC